MANFHLQIYTQESLVFDGEVSSLVAPALDGYVGVMANHAPLLSALGEGQLTFKKEGADQAFTLKGGFLEVHENHATILADELS